MSKDAIHELAFGNPLYKEVARQMTDALKAGQWQPGEAIPSEKKLGEQFGVSIGTVRKAIDELTAHRILIRQQGRGTFVASHGESRYLYSFFHISRQDGHKEYPVVELVSFARGKADEEMARELGIAVGEKVFHITNVLKLEGEPVIVDEITVPVALYPGLTEKLMRERSGTIYQLYEEEFRVSVVRTVERARAGVASSELAKLLRVKTGTALLLVLRKALSFRDQPVEFRRSWVNTERHEYRVEGDGG